MKTSEQFVKSTEGYKYRHQNNMSFWFVNLKEIFLIVLVLTFLTLKKKILSGKVFEIRLIRPPQSASFFAEGVEQKNE